MKLKTGNQSIIKHTKGIDKASAVHEAHTHASKMLEIRVDLPAN